MNFSRFALLALLVTACTFSSEEEYFENLTPPDPSKLSIDLSGYESGDTIRIYENTIFNYRINLNGGRLRWAKAKRGDQTITELHSSQGGFTYGSSNPSGTSVLSIEFESSSGTGSLADKVDGESYSGVMKWVLITDFALPPKPSISYQIEKGLLKVSWPRYTKPNFRKYRVSRRVKDAGSIETVILDPNQNIWYDSSFVPGPKEVEYYVYVENSMGSVYNSSSYSYSSGVQFSLNEADSILTVKWRKCPFYVAFRDYVVTTEYSSNGSNTIVQLADTVATIKIDKLIYGDGFTATFETNSKTKDILHNRIEAGLRMVGKKLSASGRIYYSASLHSYLIPNDKREILSFNDDLEATGKKVYSNYFDGFPYPGKHFYERRYGSTSQYVTIYFVDLANGSTNTHMGDGSIHGNGIIGSSGYLRMPSNQLIYYASIYDALNKTSIFSKSVTRNSYQDNPIPMSIAQDGMYFRDVVENKYFKVILGDTSVLTGVIPPVTGRKFLDFRADKSNEVMFTENGSIVIYDANTLNHLRTINPPAQGLSYVSYDPYSKRLLWSKSNREHFLVHIETGEVRSFKALLGYYGLYYLNGHIFMTDTGNYIKIL